MQKIAGLLLLSLIRFQGIAQDTVAILNQAQTIVASREDIQEAKNKTASIIADINEVPSLFDKFIFIGGRLWDKLKTDENFKDIEGGNVTFKVPKFDADGNWSSKQDVQGKALQNTVHYLKLWTYIKTNLDLDKAQIVEATNSDKFILWLYFAKIEEPFVVFKSEKARLILKYVKGKIFFIDISSDKP